MSAGGILRSGPGAVLALFLLGALLYVPSFSLDELDDEEGRRAVPAREMVQSGDYVVPTLWGEPYLNKPPMFFWLVAASSVATGGVTEASTRLPSVAATILTALLLYWVGRRMAGASTGLAAGAVFLVTFSIFEKGAFGELEAVFTLTVLCATAALYAASLGSRLALLGAGLALGAALLTKGPPAFVFFFAAAIAIARARGEARFLWSPRLWLPVLLATLLAGTWALLLLARPEVEDAMKTWGNQMARGSGDGLGEYLDARKSFAGSVLAGFFPPSLIYLISLGTELRRRVLEEPAARFCLILVGLGLLFFGLMPGTQGRYVHPLVPWAALFAGRLLAAQLEAVDPRFAKRAARLGRFVACLGLAVAGGAVWLLFGSIAEFDHLGYVGYTLAACLLAASLFTWSGWSGAAKARALWSTFAVLALLRLIQLGEIVPQAAGRQGRTVRAAEIAGRLPENEPLHVGTDYHYNLLFYVGHPIRRTRDPRETPSGAYLLLREEQLRELEQDPGFEAELLLTTDTHEGERLSLVRMAD